MEEMPWDAIVVGAGIIGGSIAWRLAQAGVRTTLVDAAAMGGEASWAGAGMLAPGGEIEERSDWTDLALESLGMYPGFVVELQEESGIPIDFQTTGAVEPAWDETEWEALVSRAAAQRTIGIASEPFDATQVKNAVPLAAPCVEHAMFYPGDALVDPRDVTRALRAACSRRGVRLLEHNRVSAVHAQSRTAAVEAAAGRLEAGAVILAAGAWSGEVSLFVEGARYTVPESFPVKGHLLGYRLPAGSLGPILRRGHTYILQRAGGFTIAGTSSERVGFDRRVDPVIAGGIAARAAELMPALSGAGEPEMWAGFRPATANLRPEIGRVAESVVWLAYGHYRNGILLAPITAQRMSGAITSSSETERTSPRASL